MKTCVWNVLLYGYESWVIYWEKETTAFVYLLGHGALERSRTWAWIDRQTNGDIFQITQDGGGGSVTIHWKKEDKPFWTYVRRGLVKRLIKGHAEGNDGGRPRLDNVGHWMKNKKYDSYYKPKGSAEKREGWRAAANQVQNWNGRRRRRRWRRKRRKIWRRMVDLHNTMLHLFTYLQNWRLH